MPSYIDNTIRRSRLIMPAHNKRFVEKAYLRNADCIVLDLEDSVPIQEKDNARALIKSTIPVVGRGGSDVLVRVNNHKDLLWDDIEAAVWPRLTGIYLPKAESAEEVVEVERFIAKLEEKRGLRQNSIKIGITIETALGLQNVMEIAGASERIDSVALGVEDFSLDTGIQVSGDTYHAMLIPRMQVLLAARANGILPLGLMGSLAGYSDTNEIEQSAVMAYKHGFLGASCIHPGNVEILNKGFSPTEEDITYSKRVIEAYETSVIEGKAATKLDGRMIDKPHYEKAKQILNRNEKIKEMESRKLKARETITL